MSKIKYLQNNWPEGTCYGCGPANPHGMHLKSRWSDDRNFVIAEYIPAPVYNAGMPDVMYGGTVASLIDCHSIWTAIAFAHRGENLDMGKGLSIAYVTGKLSVEYKKPTPLSETIFLRAWVEGEAGKKTRVQCQLGTENKVTALGDVIAVRLG